MRHVALLVAALWNPDAVLPGATGGLGLLLILFGIALLILELKVPSFGALGVGGTVSLVVGSIMMTRDMGADASLGVIVPIALGIAAIFLFLGRLALTAQRRPPVSGSEGMLRAIGRARDPLEPGAPGHVDVHGEIWRAVSREPIAAGQRVRITAIEGLTLVVEPAAPEGATS